MIYRKIFFSFAFFLITNCAIGRSLVVGCSDIHTSPQVDKCVANEYKVSDQSLNVTYKKIVEKINANYKADRKLGGEFQTALKNAQQAWIKFRDTNCAVEAFEIESGTTAHATTVNVCYIRMTNQRNQELQRMLK